MNSEKLDHGFTQMNTDSKKLRVEIICAHLCRTVASTAEPPELR